MKIGDRVYSRPTKVGELGPYVNTVKVDHSREYVVDYLPNGGSGDFIGIEGLLGLFDRKFLIPVELIQFGDSVIFKDPTYERLRGAGYSHEEIYEKFTSHVEESMVVFMSGNEVKYYGRCINKKYLEVVNGYKAGDKVIGRATTNDSQYTVRVVRDHNLWIDNFPFAVHDTAVLKVLPGVDCPSFVKIDKFIGGHRKGYYSEGYLVTIIGKDAPTVVHLTQESAIKEAKRLAIIAGGVPVISKYEDHIEVNTELPF